MDYREELLSGICNSLIKDFTSDELNKIKQVITIQLGNYEISERTTDIVIRDNSSEQLLQLYAGTLLTEGRAASSVTNYIRVLRRFMNEIDKPLVEVGVFDIRFWLAQQQRRVKLRTCDNYRSYLSAFYQWLLNEDIIDKNPMVKIKTIKYNDPLKFPFTDVDIDALRSGCESLRERAELELLLSSGIRVAELHNMNISDIDFNTMKVLVRKGKGNKQRTTFINDVAKVHILAYLDTRTDNNPCLFYSNKGNRVIEGTIRNDLKRIGKKSNVENVHPHRCRRTFATALARKGMNVRTIQMLMGHSNVNTTMGYITLDSEYAHNEYKRCA